MPNSKSAEKRLRQNLKRRDRNRAQRSALRTHMRRLNEAIEAGEEEQARSRFRELAGALQKAAAKGLMHKNAAARAEGRMARKLAAMSD